MILEQLAEAARIRVSAAKKQKSLEDIKREASALVKGEFVFQRALQKAKLSFIMEIKKASPSKGLIAQNFHPQDTALEYVKAGAAAISILTEPTRFLGSDEYLQQVRQVVSIPLLRKDFTVDEYQIYEAKLLGADAVLLICALLNESEIRAYLNICHELGLSALVEAHDEDEVMTAIKSGAQIIGVNNRNLRDFTVDLRNSINLRALVPEDIIFVSESGIETEDDIRELVDCGVDAVLIGETLMRSGDVVATVKALRGKVRAE